jgi:hypothetical protein
MTPRRFVRTVAGVLIIVAMSAGLAHAQEASPGGIPYLTGGVGEEERAQLEAEAKDYNLKLVFAESGGAFVADVQVTVKNDEGSAVLAATAKGPLFFAKLPEGNYTVEATYREERKESSVSLAATKQRVIDFRW